MSNPWLEALNSEQRRAVTFGGGPLLVIAGAGTGKTKTLACRVAHLIEGGVDPDRILLLTFTRRAAAEMIGRANRLIDGELAAHVWGGTFHAIANRLLRTYARVIGLDSDFTVMDQEDAADLMNLIRGEMGLASRERRFPKKQTLIKIYSHTVNAQRKLSEVVERHFPYCRDDLEDMAAIFRDYAGRKRRNNVLDYDDLLLHWRLLCDTPGAGAQVADRFEHVLVDEYQDTNAIQAAILRGMRRTHEHIMVVGDDAQSIYAFRAATIRNILDFPEQFPGAETIALEQNYRSTPPILDASNAVMGYAKERYTKNLWSKRPAGRKPVLVTCMDETQQTEAVCRNILDHFEQGVPLMQQAVLFRAGHHSAMLEVELARRNIPFHKYGGLRFLEAAHVKDLLAMLRILDNPQDELSWYRVLQLLPGVGPRTARRLMARLGVLAARRSGGEVRDTGDRARVGGEDAGGDDVERVDEPDAPSERSPIKRLITAPPMPPASAREVFESLRVVLAECAGWDAPEVGQGRDRNGKKSAPKAPTTPADPVRRKAPPLSTQIERLRVFYQPILEEKHDNFVVRQRDLEQLEQIASGYKSRNRFITELTLDPPSSTSDLAADPYIDEDYLILSTIHSAKGCEWSVVHIIHAADGMIPSDMAVEDDDGVDEERRLFYVAMTRAKDDLYVYFPLRYYHRRFGTTDAHGLAQLTRFLPPDALAHFTRRYAGLDEAASTRPRPTSVEAGLNELFRD